MKNILLDALNRARTDVKLFNLGGMMFFDATHKGDPVDIVSAIGYFFAWAATPGGQTITLAIHSANVKFIGTVSSLVEHLHEKIAGDRPIEGSPIVVPVGTAPVVVTAGVK